MIRIITGITLDRAIGVYPDNSRKGRLPWEPEESKGDLAYFKQLTENNVVIMGRKTYESLGGTLSNRTNIVVCQGIIADVNVKNAGSVEQAIQIAKTLAGEKDIYLIGGEGIFSEGMKYADEIIMTIIPIKAYERFDAKEMVYFPAITNNFRRFSGTQHPLSPSLRIITWKKMGGKQNDRKVARRKDASLS